MFEGHTVENSKTGKDTREAPFENNDNNGNTTYHHGIQWDPQKLKLINKQINYNTCINNIRAAKNFHLLSFTCQAYFSA